MATYYHGDINVTINGRDLIKESSITINEGKKYVVYGKNGDGKTTLINAIVADIERIAELEGRKRVNYLLLKQDITIEKEQTCLAFLLSADEINYAKNLRLNELSEIEEMTDKELEEYQLIGSELQTAKWDSFESEAKRILKGLQFVNPETTFTSILSGGWRMRLALGKALLMKPQLLILDEPTNHLDLEANIWLTNYLSDYPNSILLITHEKDLGCSFKGVISWYVGVAKTPDIVVSTIKGDYFKLRKYLDDCMSEWESNYDKYLKKVANYKKSKPPVTKQQIADFEKLHFVPRPPMEYSVSIEWGDVPKYNRNIISMRDISFTYGRVLDENGNIIRQEGEKKVFDRMNYNIDGDSRHILVGPNGAGKTTLFKLISDDLKQDSDSDVIIRDSRLRVGYYYQQILENLPGEMTPVEYLQSLDNSLSIGECKAILGRLSLKKTPVGDPTMIKIKNLSGGQKARVSFARVQIKNPTLIIFDEPTNHLDTETIDGFIDGINSFNGAVVIISHSIHLIRSIENKRLFVVGNGKIEEFRGDFDDYYDMIINSE